MNESMFKNCCDERNDRVTPEKSTISVRSEKLLTALKAAECKLNIIEKILFGTEPNEGKCAPPDCLSSNVDLALELAFYLNDRIEHIIERL